MFFALHFLVPWLILLLVLVHLIALHSKGSTSPLGYRGPLNKIFFYPYYLVEDLRNLLLVLLILVFMFIRPFFFGEPEALIEINPLISPIHIIPEFYFLWVYGVLRSFTNKRIGVLALVSAILLPLVLLPTKNSISPLTGINRILCWSLALVVLMLR